MQFEHVLRNNRYKNYLIFFVFAIHLKTVSDTHINNLPYSNTVLYAYIAFAIFIEFYLDSAC